MSFEARVLTTMIRSWQSAALKVLRRDVMSKVRSVLLVEQRDEVFVRLRADVIALGYSVDRAANAQEASAKFAALSADLILANRELSTMESGWLLVSKWALGRQERRVWLYTAWPAALDEDWTRFTRVQRLLYYGGNLWSLSDRIIDGLASIDNSRPKQTRQQTDDISPR